MATPVQTPATVYQNEADVIDYTPSAAVLAGDVIVVGNTVMIATNDIASNALGSLKAVGVFKAPKDTSVFAKGDPVYWAVTGTPVTGVASSGCATSVSGGNTLMGMAVQPQLTGDSYVQVRMSPTISRMPRVPVSAIAAAGSTQADGTLLTEGLNVVSAADGTKGVLLPLNPAPGTQVIVKNTAAASALKVWPAVGAAINAIAANSAYSVAAATPSLLIAQTATQWYSVPLVAS